jgi:hypothetical protein
LRRHAALDVRATDGDARAVMATIRRPARLALAFMLVLLASAAPAWAVCVCGEREDCTSAGLCFGKTPGETCFDAVKTCKIRVGSSLDEVCCCACSKPIGPIGCNYGLVRQAVSVSFACGSVTLPAQADATTTGVLAKLARADVACQAQKNAKRRADVAVRQLSRFRRKIDRAAQRGRLTADCAATANEAIDTFIRHVRQIENGEQPGSTTTTTLPPLACLATFSASPTPSDVDVRVRCDGGGGPFQRFQIVLGGGRAITNVVAPPLFTCAVIDSAGGSDTASCRGTFDVGDEIVATLRTGPPPAPGMPAELFVFDATNVLGPFPTTGP